MENILMLLLGDFILSNYYVYCWTKLNKKYINEKINYQYVLLLVLTTIVLNLTSYIFEQPVRLIMIFLLFTTINYFLISRNLKQSIIIVIISQITIWISEFAFAIISSLLYKGDIQKLTEQGLIFIGLNIFITLMSFWFHKIGFTKRLYKLLMPQRNTNKDTDSIIYAIIMVIIMIAATMETYMHLSFTVVIITNTLMAAIFIGIIIMSKNLKNSFERINSKYETSISSLKEYEVMIDKFRVDTHENKNEFLTIRNMLKDKNSKETVIKYIDKLIDNKIKDNDKIMKKTSKIPKGGLRATIYSKLCLMDKLKINYKLNISREVRTTDLINLDEDLVLKICKILGVFLDNAIEAVKDLNKKEISIEIYIMDQELCVDITNKFEGNLDLDKINNTKYTTKGDGHGYGLTLVSKLIAEESSKLENEKSINRDNFTQTLKIKM